MPIPSAHWPFFLVPALLLFIGMESPLRPPPTPVASDPVLQATPAYQRIDLPVNATTSTTIELASPVATRLLAADVDCRCISVTTPLPLDLPAKSPVSLSIKVVGVLPGVKQITLRTTTGSAKIALQVVTPGNGDGVAVLRELAAHAQAGQRLTIIVHDLKGQIRNCGCSTGSLGGIDRLAALPAEWARLAPGVQATFYLSGTVEAHQPGVAAALVEHGWKIATPAEVIAGDLAALAGLSKPDGPFIILTPDAVGPQHARVLRPPLFEGLVAIAVIPGQSPVVIPIDRSLPAVPGIIERFPEARTIAVNVTASPSISCATCHQSAFAAWQGSAHARAWSSLKPVDQVDSCVVCHTTPTPVEKVRVALVHCQACHVGADAHAVAPAVKTKGAADCRGCHDAKHHPGFQREVGWKVIGHGR